MSEENKQPLTEEEQAVEMLTGAVKNMEGK